MLVPVFIPLIASLANSVILEDMLSRRLTRRAQLCVLRKTSSGSKVRE